MFHMFERMTIGAQDSKIAQFIVVSIMIYMMNPQYFWFFGVSTIFAFFNQTSCKHIFSNSSKFTFPCFSIRFINTCLGTIFSAKASIRQKFILTMDASVFNCPFSFLGFVITNCRAIFCFINSCCNKFKFLLTNITWFFKPFLRRFSSAKAGTKFGFSETMRFYRKLFITYCTVNNHGETYAS